LSLSLSLRGAAPSAAPAPLLRVAGECEAQVRPRSNLVD
jgi:hypothetical protein